MEQANGIQQVNRAVRQMDEVTQSNAALVEEAAAAADTVQARARSLVTSVGFFNIGHDDKRSHVVTTTKGTSRPNVLPVVASLPAAA